MKDYSIRSILRPIQYRLYWGPPIYVNYPLGGPVFFPKGWLRLSSEVRAGPVVPWSRRPRPSGAVVPWSRGPSPAS